MALVYLNPLDFGIWSALQTAVYMERPQTEMECRVAVTNAIEGVGQGFVDKCIDSFSNRLNAVVDIDGGHIGPFKSTGEMCANN